MLGIGVKTISANMKTEGDELYSRKDTMFLTDEKKNAFMEAWLAFKEKTDAQDLEFAA